MFTVEGFGDPTGLSPAELVDRLHDLEHQRRLLDAALVAVVGEAQRSGAFREDGHASVAGWCRALTRWSDVEVVQHRRVADLAAASEPFTAALARGSIGVAQAAELARAHANPRCGAELLDDVTTFLTKADRVPYREFRDRLAQWTVVHDADGAHRDTDYTDAHRDAVLTVFDGVLHGELRGGAADGAVMTEIFERFRDAEFHADWDATVARYGDEASAALMPRTEAQRRFDAMRAIFDRAAAQHPDATNSVPLVNLVIDVHTLDALLHAGAPTLPTEADVWRRRCGTLDGATLAPGDVLDAMWWGQVRAVVVDDHDVIVAMGRKRRLFTGRARDAVLMRSERCVYAGCDRPAARCEADHIDEYQHGGRTDPHNGGPGCDRHNRFRSRHRYRVHRDTDGTWHTYRPDGTEIR